MKTITKQSRAIALHAGLVLALIQLVSPAAAESPSMVYPMQPMQVPDLSPGTIPHRVISNPITREELKRLILESGGLAYAQNALDNNGRPTGKPDPVLMKLLMEPTAADE